MSAEKILSKTGHGHGHPNPPLPPVPGPPPPIVTISFVEGSPSAFGEQVGVHSSRTAVQFNFALAINSPVDISGVIVDTYEFLLVTAPVSEADAMRAIADEKIAIKKTTRRTATPWSIVESGVVVFALPDMNNAPERHWTLVARALGSSLVGGGVIAPRIVRTTCIRLQVDGGIPPLQG